MLATLLSQNLHTKHAVISQWADHIILRRKIIIVIPTIALVVFAFIIYNSSDVVRNAIPTFLQQPVEQQPPTATQQPIPIAYPEDFAANSTLGFEKILALSSGPSWRTRGLEAAAELTGLKITIPPQSPIPNELVDIFTHLGDGTDAQQPKPGSAKAWLAHLDLLRFVIASDLQTAFIIEDDVDWDLVIKSQMSLVSENVRKYTNVPPEDPTPFGADWDVLWLGHCGSWVRDGMAEPLLYLDPTRIGIEDYSGWSRPYIRDTIPEGHRQVQECLTTVCSFGYGVSKQSAPKILNLLALGQGEGFDVMLAKYCHTGRLRCLVVNPQLFNHYEPPLDKGYVSQVHAGDGLGTETDGSLFEAHKGFTGNIVESARCKALFNETCVRPGADMKR